MGYRVLQQIVFHRMHLARAAQSLDAVGAQIEECLHTEAPDSPLKKLNLSGLAVGGGA